MRGFERFIPSFGAVLAALTVFAVAFASGAVVMLETRREEYLYEFTWLGVAVAFIVFTSVYIAQVVTRE